ncbi:glycosyltransferase family 2 protein, partial [Accumulibacter sp.]|uniref:glycosyltransferase family 2 protein n=1 Tax=Accumulibacter sp. TaxID=2053492 RepID=UPI0028C4C52B
MKLISVVTGCFNEEDNVDELYQRIRAQFERLPAYDYEHIFIDNASSDSTVDRIKAIAAGDRRVKLIVNTRNFGHIRSPIHALLQARGDAVIAMASDLQEPPELIPEFIDRWEKGYRIVAGVKPSSTHSTAMSFVRKVFYSTIGRISDTRLIPNFTGFGLYDRSVVEIIRQMDDPYPYFRGLI